MATSAGMTLFHMGYFQASKAGEGCPILDNGYRFSHEQLHVVAHEQNLSTGSERVRFLYKGDMLWIVNCNNPH